MGMTVVELVTPVSAFGIATDCATRSGEEKEACPGKSVVS